MIIGNGTNHKITNITMHVTYICNMGRSNLPNMYTRALGRAAPEGECGHIRQIMAAYVTYVM